MIIMNFPIKQGSRWTFQATRMDGRIGSIDIKPDQLQLVNALMILALLPIFESFVYPTFKKCGLPLTLIQRMSIGCFLLSGAFIMSGIVELQLEVIFCLPVNINKYCSIVSLHY